MQDELLNGSIYIESNFEKISSPQTQIIAIHGIGTHSGWFAPMHEVATTANVGLAALDLPGFGKSKTSDEITYRSWTDAVAALYAHCKAKNPNAKTYILGHSLGSLVALVSLSRHVKPDGLILTVPALCPHPKSYPMFGLVLPANLRGLCPRKKNTLMDIPYPVEIKQAIQDRRISLETLTPQITSGTFLEVSKLMLLAWTKIYSLSELSLLMVLAGRDETCVSSVSELFYSHCNAKKNQSELIYYPDMGHDLFVLPEAEGVSRRIIELLTV